MAIRKSIRDIQSSNIISDMVAEEPIAIKTKKIDEIKEMPPMQEDSFEDNEPVVVSGAGNNRKRPSFFKRIMRIISQIRPIYLVIFLVIIAGLIALIFIPSPAAKDPSEQDRIEAEMVKEKMSKHIMLPQNEQIDIRKITSKMDDPFFKDAEIGDYLIILYKNRIAYIYSIDKDIIVNAGVVFIDPKTATTTGSTTTKKQ